MSAREVRLATADDKPELLRLLRDSHAEGGLYSLSEEKINFTIDRLLARNSDAFPIEDRGFVGVIGPVGALEACAILATEASHWYSENISINEYLIYVDVQHRHGSARHLRDLVSFATKCADQTRLPVELAVLQPRRTAAKVRIFQKLIPLVGVFLIYPPAQICDGA